MLSLSSDEEEIDRTAIISQDSDVQISSTPVSSELALPPSKQQALRESTSPSRTLDRSQPWGSYMHSARPSRSSRKSPAISATISLSLVDANTTSNSPTSLRSSTYTYPCRAASTVKSLSMMFRILEEMHCALHAGRVVTKRDIYYRAPALFGSQAAVDRLVDDIASQLGVRRSALGVTAASKGLIAGAASIRLIDSDATSSEATVTLSHQHKTLIPNVDDISEIDTTSSWLLVVEKEAVFQTLVEAGITSGRTPGLGHGILVTGKGYPDLITREFLARISQDCPLLSILVLVDHDPFGLHIFEQYLKAMPPDSNIRLLGLRSRDLQHLPSSTDRDLLPLTRADRVRAENTLAQESLNQTIRDELQSMLAKGYKAELEILSIARRRRRSEEALEEQHSQSGAANVVRNEERDGLVEFVEEKLRVVLGGSAE
ncbi:DNA topoisomerase IV, alpha subunit [Microstroma glucosiphilum]|uniref:DNA topoisomerase (ATP-hydrolyzing) n=1 Tax=Pseudomicrostroma glucosiphilum TaxID=1684307 RepID=A0A316U6Y4_9BASI|nr:DNA topoisomerase IV, alpha subunit [Pseudomicrostroma glucosiphilum]PWN20990.1 DNA topoisomerase IV, alpha subunit [Pseudomicrostroma glucosiphilum]